MSTTTDNTLELASKYSKARKDYQDRNGYKATELSRFSSPTVSPYAYGSRADQQFRSEYQYHLLAEMAEDLDRNNSLAPQALDRLCCNVLQDGFPLEPKTGDKEADKVLTQEWQSYTNDERRVDRQDEYDFDTLGWIALRSALTRGDIVSLPIFDESIQLIENYRVRSPQTSRDESIRFGMKLDRKSGRATDIYLTRDDLREFRAVDDTKVDKYPIYDEDGHRQVFLHKLPGRVTMPRGISIYSPIMHHFGMHDDIQFAKMVQQQMVSCVTWVRKREMGFEHEDGDPYRNYRKEPDPCHEGNTRPINDLSPGMWYTTYPGEDLNVLNSNVPNPTFFDHAKSIQQIIGLNFGLPLILFLMDASETNFSGWRGALDQAKLGFKKIQKSWRRTWYRKHYRTKLRMWSDSPMQNRHVARAFRRLGPDLFNHEFILPGWPYVEPLKDIQADALEIRTGINSPRRVQKRHSRDWETVSTEIVQDNALIVRKAKTEAVSINKEFKDDQPVHWRELANMPTPEGVAATLNDETLAEKEEVKPDAKPDARTTSKQSR